MVASPETHAFVKATLASHGVTVFSKTYCPYCTQAKSVLTSVGAPYHVIELDVVPNGDEILQALIELTGRRTVPNVFVQDVTIGGGSDVAQLQRDGKLVPLLQNAGVLV
ncbi:hypothetical protein SPRG_08568 [Saprolegnia parasitica CBS 223.65]|uniref:Glutaredoxin domain-containing protein n=1 Tax=Saprolegnia parasitica (strain CBS 223.65) TaxID=695850 RepID=A0A067CI63_SAPPC|nr:hypothetical protein SPRG_08568 [Saprolegnia parasitica CBS 223.65]KDO26206.1 hypothetical protein SPRG_08568 [Saprolegnia parasitica CBS 223.65]|eukprot:XP_012203198.1 hypothetical protein SPRG_08568 [Saprolegnia parasitica CBS 223.65]